MVIFVNYQCHIFYYLLLDGPLSMPVEYYFDDVDLCGKSFPL